ncbi:MAG TPA: class I SAM-dependent methyltransferase [Acetivibrio sp.]|jgi:ubiquinone/menaquinone biosynthesis C-methylase UbiE|nr:class I SAM-dependent methyltransferase [Acetivibrio sp.]
MSKVEEKLAKSLTAETTELIPYLPYLLQDLWELGSSPMDIIEMTSKNIKVTEKTKVLDLACGKGAVSVNLAKALGCSVKGIDLIPEFIEYADLKAKEYGVFDLCRFEVGDINEAVKEEKDYDIVILGAVGDVLGNPKETVEKLTGTVKKGGYIFIDDAYGTDDFDEKYPTREKWLKIFDGLGVKLLDERIVQEDEVKSVNDEQQSFIIKRANELKIKHPDKAYLFDSYVESQQAECDELENEITGVTMLLQVI